MLDLKSINLYFFSLKKIITFNIRKIYFRTNFYNKNLQGPLPSRIYYHPSAYLISSLNLINNKYIINNLPSKKTWSWKKNNNSNNYNNLPPA